MDGNRRYAKSLGLSAIEGHRLGAEKLKEVVGWAQAQGVQCLFVYAFSTENWKRDPREVADLLALFEKQLSSGLDDLAKKISLRFMGERSRFPLHVQELMKRREQESEGKSFTLAVLLSYGGRAEILNAVNTVLGEGKEQVTETDMATALWSAALPDPDLIIRTGGEQRLSNFLTWQSVYSELVFTDTLWPALTKEEFENHLELFQERKRNFGV